MRAWLLLAASASALHAPQPLLLHRAAPALSHVLPRPLLRTAVSAPPRLATPSCAAAATATSDDDERLPPTVLPITLLVFVQLLGEGIAISSLPLHMRSMGASAGIIGFATSCFSLAQMVCAPIMVRLSSKLGRRKLLRACLAGATLSQTIIAASPSYYGILVGRFLGGVFAASIPIAQAGVTDLVRPSQSALAISRVSAASQMGVVVGPAASALFAALFAYIGVPAQFRIRGVFALSAVFASIVLLLNRGGGGGDDDISTTTALSVRCSHGSRARPRFASPSSSTTTRRQFLVRFGCTPRQYEQSRKDGRHDLCRVLEFKATWRVLPS